MKLQRIRIEQVRQFRAPFELSGLDAGLNLFCGPNEAGKSTLVRAIRAAFFERYRSQGVDDLRPWHDDAASPTVELDFVVADTQYRLRKTFLRRHRCELLAGSRRLEGEEAERQLAELLGYDYAQRGASREEHWGIPGLLWIEQGDTHRIDDPVTHATEYLRRALGQSVSEVAASHGDALIERVRADRARLFTPTGNPTLAYKAAIEDHARALQHMQELDDRIVLYRRQVDELAQLRGADADEARTKPWETHARAAEAAQARLAELDALRARVLAGETRLGQIAAHVRLLQDKLSACEADRRSLREREEALAQARLAAERADLTLARWKTELATAQAGEQRAAQTLAMAQERELREELGRRVQETAQRIVEMSDRLGRAERHQAKIAGHRKTAGESLVDPGLLAELRQRHATMLELRIRQSAAATRVTFDLESQAKVRLGQDSLTGRGERLLTGPGQFDIEGVGRLSVEPGGTDLADLARELARCEADVGNLLRRCGAASPDEAEARHAAHENAKRDMNQEEQWLRREAPKGLDALRAEKEELEVRRRKDEEQFAALPALANTAEAGTPATVTEARAHHDAARRHLAGIAEQTALETNAGTAAQSRVESAERECNAARSRVENPQRSDEERAAVVALAEAGKEQADLSASLATLRDELSRSRPDILTQDVERLRRSADLARRAFDERQGQMLLLQGKLESSGAEGLEEQRAEQAAVVDAAARRLAELALQARALDLLLRLLEEKRAELTRKLQSPLRRHLDRYLQLLFPEATLELGEDLVPRRITRKDNGAEASGDVASLSYGAREQMGVITRLAYADLLKEAGRPTLIILDDALVHSDHQRLAQMKRVLFDAAHRHQVLLFTCHPEAWGDLGVAVQGIGRDAVTASSA